MTREELIARKAQPANVPCGACRACCQRDRIVLQPDESSRFAHHCEGPQLVLDRQPNGACVYLRANGCAVHDAPPDICRRFDCRVLFLLTPKVQRRARISENPTMRHVYEAGKVRANTLRTAP